jgi:hypothetical protein
MENKPLMHVPSVTFAHQKEWARVGQDPELEYGVACVSQRTNRKGSQMSALPTPRPQGRQKDPRQKALRTIARLLEEQMEEMGLSDAEKNARTEEFVQRVKKLKASRAANPSK